MTQYGDKSEPGIVTEVTSSVSAPVFGEAPQNLCLVGHGDLDNASDAASTDEAYQITRAQRAVQLFGPPESSLLTRGIIDALTEGAFPVYAVVTPENEQNIDLGSESTPVVDVANNHLREDEAQINATFGGSSVNPIIVYDDVSSYTPNSGEVYINPVAAEAHFPSDPSSGGGASVTVDTFDYVSAVQTARNALGGVVDFLVPLSERKDVVDAANTAVTNMEDFYEFALAIGGAAPYISDTLSYTQRYDDSRTQVVYPTRFEDGSSALAAYAGMRASLGLQQTPINRRVKNNSRLVETLNRAERGNLIDHDVVPLADEARGVKVVDDPTTASNENKDERNLAFGFNRLVADYIIETTRLNEQPYIGKLNRSGVQTVLERMVNQQLNALQESDVVLDYNVRVVPSGPTTATVEMSVDLVEPLRFIENEVVIEQGRAGV